MRKNNRSKPGVFTYQTRISSYDGTCREGGDSLLSAYADLFGRIKRSLLSKYCSGEDIVSLKKRFLAEYAIPARLFNSIRVSLEGNISSVRELQPLRLESAKRRVSRAEQQIGKLLKDGETQQVHQKRRRLAKLQHRLHSLNSDVANGKVRICFGSRKLWRKQYNLQANGYGSHDEWLQDWQATRSDEFFLILNPPKGCDRGGETGGRRGGNEITGLDADRYGLLPGAAIEGRGFLTARSTGGG